jgi:hypothetical protein
MPTRLGTARQARVLDSVVPSRVVSRRVRARVDTSHTFVHLYIIHISIRCPRSSLLSPSHDSLSFMVLVALSNLASIEASAVRFAQHGSSMSEQLSGILHPPYKQRWLTTR